MSNSEIITKLIEQNISIATAESCTGGSLGKIITSVPGASGIYGYGFITYANEAKEKLLGVPHEVLQSVGAVSSETALSMAEGARRVSGSDIGVSTTGIAGPGGGTEEKPVGTVFVAVVYGEREDVQLAPVRRKWSDRGYTRHTSASFALSRVLKMIK